MSKKKQESDILYVNVCEAKPNKMFTEEQRRGIRFLIYNKKVPCAECGKMDKEHWTALYQFTAASMGDISLTESGKIHAPLTPVCCDHLLAPAFDK